MIKCNIFIYKLINEEIDNCSVFLKEFILF